MADSTKNKQAHLLPSMYYLIFTPPKSVLCEFLQESRKLIQREPLILDLIHQDLDRNGIRKKKLRLQDRSWAVSQNPSLPLQDITHGDIPPEALTLKVGRPRMSPILCYYFLMIRAFADGVSSHSATNLIFESKSVEILLHELDVNMPSETAIIENTNAVSNETRLAILDAQVRMILDEGHDDFTKITIDSTAVHAQSAWPTDSTLIHGLLNRIWQRGKKLLRFGLPNMSTKEIPGLIEEIYKIGFKIALCAGRKGAPAKRKILYEELIDLAEIGSLAVAEELTRIKPAVQRKNLQPSKRLQVERLWHWLESDLQELNKLIVACIKRVLEDQKPNSNDRLLSLSDSDAAMIIKSTHDPTLGYRVQVGRSAKGFVVDVTTEPGNPADSAMLQPSVDRIMGRTQTVPDQVCADGGYASKKNRKWLLEKGVQLVSFTSQKGKDVTPIEEWESDEHREARAGRSAVESIIYQLKNKVSFGRLKRCGIQAVLAELVDKVLAFNFLRLCRV